MTKLEKYFHLYNKKYFDNQLPPAVLRWADIKYYGHYYPVRARGSDVTHIIEIGSWSRPKGSIWKFTLLHEMSHLALRDKRCKMHGRLFNNEMKRLANLGAFNGLW